MTPQIAKVEVLPEYRLYIRFRNREARMFDMRPYLDKGVFKELRNEAYLKKVRIISGGIEWPHDQDVARRREKIIPKGIRDADSAASLQSGGFE